VLLDATRRYSTLLDATRRYSTLLDATRRYSTLIDEMMLEQFPNEVLTEIFSNLGPKDIFLSVALVCKRFRELSLFCLPKCVEIKVRCRTQSASSKRKFNRLLDILGINRHLEKLVLHVCLGYSVTKILQIVAQHGNFYQRKLFEN
jgi:hypothetical protein